MKRRPPRGPSGVSDAVAVERTIDPRIREELNQSPAWWDQEFRKAESEHYVKLPFDPAEHEGHDISEILTIAGPGSFAYCLECPTVYVPKVNMP